ncbi:DUF1541 domain-containing protein [Halobacillus fulvus]|nr:DUF1541 domain-containing protein [Halobacillus fulvus]
MKKKWISFLLLIVLAAVVAACGDQDDGDMNMDGNMDENMEENMDENMQENMDEEMNEQMDEQMGEGEDMHMDHSSSGEVPDDLQEADNPTYEVGSQAIIQNGHMDGMEGAEATIVGAYDTTAYAVTYTPTDGGEPVENHKWVIHEELPDPGEAPLEEGAEVTLEASHMEGMDGATATIDSAEQTTVYMIDFTPTNSDEEVKNHKWVTEEELAPVE